MIKLSVVSYSSEIPAQAFSAIFDEKGGTLGRGEDNHFVLPDPKRHVSRVQAMVRSNGVRHCIINLSQANPILLNGDEVAFEREHELKAGDEIQIGLYLLRVEPDENIADERTQRLSDYRGDTHRPAVADVPANEALIPRDFDPFSLPSQAARNRSDPLENLSNNDVSLESFNKGSIADLMAPASPAPYVTAIHPGDPPSLDPLALLDPEQALLPKQNSGFSAYAVADHVQEISGHFDAPQAQTAVSYPEAAAQASSADGRELMQAFLRGARLAPNTVSAEATPEFMTIIGELLATSIQGTVELIGSRALVKREVKADMTMIVAAKNNPFKFLPDGQTVLLQMLREKVPGFMEPVEAMQDAYEDLRAHQLGVVAGMKAAMTEVLQRFSPESLEGKQENLSFMDTILPAARKARMWDRYAALFAQIRVAAQDDFEGLFGKAFVAAYEIEIERFKSGARDGR